MKEHHQRYWAREHRAGFALRGPPRKNGKRPKIPYMATIDGEIIMGMFFKTREEAIAFADHVIKWRIENGIGRPAYVPKL